jgi:Gram-negative bacterial TonB protein C-terminal
MMKRPSIVARALVFSILFAAAASSQPIEWSERWAAVLTDTDKLLVAGEPERARRILSELVREIVEASRPSDQADALLAVALTQLAVAEAGTGHTEDAVWIWHMAQNIVRDVAARVDLGAYGEPGELLRRNALPPPPERCAQATSSPTLPSISKRREPDYPAGARRFAVGGILIVQIEIDASGRPIRPQLMRKQAGPLAYATLAALHEWRFERKPTSQDLPFCVVFQYSN